MRVLFVSLDPFVSSKAPDGAGTHLTGLIEAMRQYGVEIHPFIAGDNSPDSGKNRGDLTAQLKRRLPTWLRVAKRDIRLILHDRNCLPQLLTVAREFQPDLLYERQAFLHDAGRRLARELRVPRVLEVNAPTYQIRFTNGCFLYSPALAKEKVNAADASAVITVSSALRDYLLERGIRPDKVYTIHNGVDKGWAGMSHADNPSAGTRARDEPVTVGFVGSFTRWQGIPKLIEAFRRAVLREPELTMVLIGDGPLRRQTETMVRDYGIANKVTFTGQVLRSQVPDLLTRVDIAVLADNMSYGSPTKIFEYGAAGKAVIAPRTPAIVEVIEDGVTGLLITPGDAEELANAIVRLARDRLLRCQLGTNWQRKVASEHSWNHVAQKVLAICQKVLARQ